MKKWIVLNTVKVESQKVGPKWGGGSETYITTDTYWQRQDFNSKEAAERHCAALLQQGCKNVEVFEAAKVMKPNLSITFS